MSNSNQLRSRLVELANEMNEQIELALRALRHEATFPARGSTVDYAHALSVMLHGLRGCALASEQYRKWQRDVFFADPDDCGLTSEERAEMFGPQVKEVRR